MIYSEQVKELAEDIFTESGCNLVEAYKVALMVESNEIDREANETKDDIVRCLEEFNENFKKAYVLVDGDSTPPALEKIAMELVTLNKGYTV